METSHSHSQSALPILASALLNDGELDGLFEGIVDASARKRREVERRGEDGVLGIGSREVDEGVGGGVRGGRLVGVSGEGVELSLGLLTTSLLTSSTSLAAIIDTSGNLDVLHIYSLLIDRLRKNEHLACAQQATDNPSLNAEDVAAKVLERVKIMRVFDLEGIVEAVEEVKEGLEKREEVIVPSTDGLAKESEEETSRETKPLSIARKTVIADSEDEDEDDEEMLLEHPVVAEVSKSLPDEAKRTETLEETKREDCEGKVSFLLIDNLAHVVNPLLKKDFVQATAQSTSLLHSLTILTRTHNLHTILLNPAPVPSSRPAAPPTPNHAHTNPDVHIPQPQPQQQSSKPQPTKSPSIFTSTSNIPALSHILPRYLDLHLFVSRLPKSRADARAMGADSAGRAHAGTRTGMETIVEVLGDRCGEGVGSWGVLGNIGMEVQEMKERGGQSSGMRSAWGLSWQVVRG